MRGSPLLSDFMRHFDSDGMPDGAIQPGVPFSLYADDDVAFRVSDFWNHRHSAGYLKGACGDLQSSGRKSFYHYHRVLADLRPAADSGFAGIGVLPLLSGSDDASSGSDDAFKEGALPVDPNRTDDVDLPLYFRPAGFGAFYHKRPELQAGK